MGYPSLFAYCIDELSYSEDIACKRIAAARLSFHHPEVFSRLEEGRLSLTSLVILAPCAGAPNFNEILDWASGRPTRELEAFVASAIPGRAVKDRLRWVNESCVEFHFAADRQCAEMLERAREISRHEFPEGRYGDVVSAALEFYLESRDLDRNELPSKQRGADPHGRYIPAAVKKAVWQRDNGRCAYISSRGRRCGSRAWIEFDHIQPFAEGGRSDREDNIRLLCRTHNQRLARDRFGIRALPKRKQVEMLPLIPRDDSASAARRIEGS